MSAQQLGGVDLELLRQASDAFRLQEKALRIDGVPFNLGNYPYLVDLFDEPLTPGVKGAHASIRKGAQMGFTGWAVINTIDKAGRQYPRGILYAFPTSDDVTDFSKSRFDRILRENDSLKRVVKSTNAANIKNVGGCIVYFRGMRSKSRLKSIPCDLVVFDERDEMEQSMYELALKRIDGSAFRHVIELSTPTVPDYGVDLAYQKSDQRIWEIRCRSCGRWCHLELEFPRCLERQTDGSVKRVCVRCKSEVFPSDGQWKATVEGVDERGWWVSQLSSPTVPPVVILDEYEDPTIDVGEFHNSRLAMAYADLSQIITDGMLKSCVSGEYGRQTHATGPCAMGGDIGKKDIYVQIGQRVAEKRFQLLAYFKVHSFGDVHDLRRRFNVQVGVLDQMAETRSVREFCESAPGFYGCIYRDKQTNDFKWNEKERTVTVQRTESIDDSHQLITDERIELPRPDDEWLEEWAPQMKNLARVVRTDPETGQREPRWIVKGRKNDHYRHAFNYLNLALERAPLARRVQQARRRARSRGRMVAQRHSWMAS